MDALLREKEKYVRKAQALALIELVANSTVAIAKAAAEHGIAAPFAIAATLLALMAGFIKAKQAAESAAFFEGGFSGEGNPREESLKLGRRGYTYHKGEFIFNAEKTSKYKPIFEQIHAGRMDLREEMKKASLFDKLEMGRNIGTHDLIIKNSRLEAGNIEGKLERIEKAILEQKTEVNFDENGLHIIASKVQFKNNRIKKEAR